MGGHKGIHLFYKYLGQQVTTTVVSTAGNDDSFAENYRLIKVFGDAKGRYANVFNFFTIKQIIRREKITHLICEHPYMGWLAVLLTKSTGIRLVVHSHNIEGLRFKSAGKWWWQLLWQYERWVYRRADVGFFINAEDKGYALQHFGLSPSRCFTITYGTERATPPDAVTKAGAKKQIQEAHRIAPNEAVLLFNGALNYAPNQQALDVILNAINPLLEKTNGFAYKIIICGKALPESYDNLRDWQQHHIIFAGFVPDIEPYLLAADIFINPVIEGGGIKTKLVEALAYGNNVVSTVSGAAGIPQDCAGNQLRIVPDGDWKSFADAIIYRHGYVQGNEQFFTHFYWGNIAKFAAAAMQCIA